MNTGPLCQQPTGGTEELQNGGSKAAQPRLANAIKRLQTEVQMVQGSPDHTEEEIQEQTLLLTEQMNTLENKKWVEARQLVRMLSSPANSCLLFSSPT